MLLEKIKKHICTLFSQPSEKLETISAKEKDLNKHYWADGIYLTETITFGRDEIVYVDENKGIRKTIVDSNGIINNFPGVVKEDFWIKSLNNKEFSPKIRYRTSIENKGDKWMMYWEIQPDGRYWGDDGGFGMEHSEEIVLYTYLNLDGDFTGPFRVYSAGIENYFNEE